MSQPNKVDPDERGFSLIELLVVIIIISILAAITIPLFIRQRDKAYVAQSQSALANAKLVAESYYVGNDGSYEGLADKIDDEGLSVTPDVAIAVVDDAASFCVTAIHLMLPADHAWKTGWVSHQTPGPNPGICS